ncbi:MAG: SDR family oxidoreductase [Gammaproteobacteria bacterium]|nr:SDR family oxidoreductase [Gammaproteobacteria bacterium]
MPTVLITGANRGLGLEFCRQYLESGWNVLACCRSPGAASALGTRSPAGGTLTQHALDVADFQAIDALAASLGNTPIDILINNAGVYGDTRDRRLGQLDYPRWADVLRINALAPVKLTEALLGNLKAGQRKLVVAVSSLMGSIADNGSGGSMLYRSSKAALNAAMKTLSIDLRTTGIGTLILHPGWVRTDMGGPEAPTLPPESVAGMRRVIEGFTPALSGRFLDFRGSEMPW